MEQEYKYKVFCVRNMNTEDYLQEWINREAAGGYRLMFIVNEMAYFEKVLTVKTK